MHVFLPQLLRPVAAENSMCRPLKEVKSFDTILKTLGNICHKFISNYNKLCS